MKVALVLAVLISITSLTSAMARKPEVQMSGLQLQQLQSKDFDAKMDTVYPSVISVLQDSGYRIQSADRASGLITATASTKSQTTYNLFQGMGKKKDTPVVSAFIEPRGVTATRVRLNFVMTETKNRRYMSGQNDEEMITDPVVYQKAFEQIGQAIFIRAAMDAPPTSPAPPIAASVNSSVTASETLAAKTVVPK